MLLVLNLPTQGTSVNNNSTIEKSKGYVYLYMAHGSERSNLCGCLVNSYVYFNERYPILFITLQSRENTQDSDVKNRRKNKMVSPFLF